METLKGTCQNGKQSPCQLYFGHRDTKAFTEYIVNFAVFAVGRPLEYQSY